MENCYSAIDDTDYNTEVCTLENMKGAAAETNMPKLDWENVWKTTDGFPVFKNINLDGVKAKSGTARLPQAMPAATVPRPILI